MMRTLPRLRWFILSAVLLCAISCLGYILIVNFLRFHKHIPMMFYLISLASQLFFFFIVWHVVMQQTQCKRHENDFLDDLSSTDLFKLRLIAQGFTLFIVHFLANLGAGLYVHFSIEPSIDFLTCISLFFGSLYMGYGSILLAYCFYICYPNALRNPLSAIPLMLFYVFVSKLFNCSEGYISRLMLALLRQVDYPLKGITILVITRSAIQLFVLAFFIWAFHRYLALYFKDTFYCEGEPRQAYSIDE
jgi:hypothetical protein